MTDKFKTSHDEDTDLAERTEIESPRLYKLFLVNDDYTTMDFVIHILEKVFRKNPAEAAQIMLHVHKNGKGLAGIYTREIAETKSMKVVETARRNNYPLQCVMEKE